MTLYLLFAGLGVLVYIGVAFAAAVSGNRAPVDLGFHVALFASVSIALAAVLLFYASRLVRAYAFVFVLVCVGTVTIVIASSRDSGEGVSTIASNDVQAAVAASEPEPEQAQVGQELFKQFGCIGCHRPDGEGIGPALAGVFGRPVTDPGCGVLTVDEEYVRESILNPSATVAAGFAPVMPAFAGRVTEEQLRALIAYVRSLKGKTP